MDRQLIVVMVTAYMMERELTMDMPEFKHKPRELEYMPNDIISHDVMIFRLSKSDG